MKQVGLVIIVFVLSALANAQSTTSTVQVTNESYSKIKVVVSQTTALRTVLEDFCRETKATCTGTEMADAQTVSPMSVSGTWSDVVSRILDGTRLNYAAGAPSGNTPPQLLIQGTATAVDPPRPMAEQPSEPMTMANSGSSMGQPNSPEQPQPVSNSSDPSYSQPTASNEIPSAMQPNWGSSSGAAYLPFPDRNGRPIALPTETAAYLPFADNGKLIPLPPPVQSNVLPFPDANGKPIVMSTEPPQYLPFPDNGKLIPWPKAPH